jgi:ribonuclease VapC
VDSLVLDASALMALLRGEPGADIVASALGIIPAPGARSRAPEAAISAINYSEVLKKTLERGTPEVVVTFVHSLDIDIVSFDADQAAVCATLSPQATEHGLSFADLACLALAVVRRSRVLTAEPKMAMLSLPIKVKVIRNEG